jgi:hypothetical protein
VLQGLIKPDECAAFGTADICSLCGDRMRNRY